MPAGVRGDLPTSPRSRVVVRQAAAKLVNGARGIVVAFRPAAAQPDVREAPPLPVASAAAAAAEQEASLASIALAEAAGGASAAGAASAFADPDGLVDAPPTGLYPVVAFSCGVERLLLPETWSVEQGGVVTASRVQVPLKLAWALSIVRGMPCLPPPRWARCCPDGTHRRKDRPVPAPAPAPARPRPVGRQHKQHSLTGRRGAPGR